MSEESKPPEDAPREPEKAPKLPILDVYVNSLHVSDRIALAALITAVVATFIGVMQTAFMWVARNDEVEATLRAEQLRACVDFRNAGILANTHMQRVALGDIEPDEDAERLERLFAQYYEATGKLMYLLPERAGEALEGVDADAIAAYTALQDGDLETLRTRVSANSPWAASHARVVEQCDRIIRDVRNR